MSALNAMEPSDLYAHSQFRNLQALMITSTVPSNWEEVTLTKTSSTLLS